MSVPLRHTLSLANRNVLPTLIHELVVQLVKLGGPLLRRIRQQHLAEFDDVQLVVAVRHSLFRHPYTPFCVMLWGMSTRTCVVENVAYGREMSRCPQKGNLNFWRGF